MNAKLFTERFRDLMKAACEGPEIPMGVILLELETMHHRMMHLAIELEQRQAQKDSASKIIRAGSMPDIPPPQPPS